MILKKIDLRTAAAFFNTYEHLGNCGLGVWHWAALENDSIVGVVSFGTTCFARSRGLLSTLADQFGLAIYQICRGGTIHTAPLNTPSEILSGAMRELRRDRGGCLIVAYSDKSFNEVGTIYQACNGLYTGQTKPKDQSNYLINGKIMSGWLVRKKYGTRAMDDLKKIDPGIVKTPLTRKYRYIFVQAAPRTKSKVVTALGPFVLSYPTRESENIEHMNVAALVSRRSGVHNSKTNGQMGIQKETILSNGAFAHEFRAKDSTVVIAARLPLQSVNTPHTHFLSSNRITSSASPGED